MALKRAECYDLLFKMKKESNVDVDEILRVLASSDRVPQEVLDFIDAHMSRTVDDFIYNISRYKKFYNNICFNYTDDIATYIKAFLSLLTHIEITIEKNEDLREQLVNIFPIGEICQIVIEHLVNNDNDDEIIAMARRLKALYLGGDNFG